MKRSVLLLVGGIFFNRGRHRNSPLFTYSDKYSGLLRAQCPRLFIYSFIHLLYFNTRLSDDFGYTQFSAFQAAEQNVYKFTVSSDDSAKKHLTGCLRTEISTVDGNARCDIRWQRTMRQSIWNSSKWNFSICN